MSLERSLNFTSCFSVDTQFHGFYIDPILSYFAILEGKIDTPPPKTDKQAPSDSLPAREESTSRRDFLTRAGHAVAGVCALSAAVGGVRVAVPDFEEGLPQRFPLGRPTDFKMNTLTWLQDRDLFVMRSEAGMGAFSCRCTHLGCMVRRTSDGFVCPCHGAEYGPLGEVISGPARRPLPWYRVWLERDGRLWVDLGRPLDDAGPRPVVLPQGNRA